jgi:hypothetical protein
MSKEWPEPTDPLASPRQWRETSDGLYREIEPDVWWRTHGIDLVGEAVVDAHCASERCGIVVVVETLTTLH